MESQILELALMAWAGAEASPGWTSALTAERVLLRDGMPRPDVAPR